MEGSVGMDCRIKWLVPPGKNIYYFFVYKDFFGALSKSGVFFTEKKTFIDGRWGLC
jgi:hypothetical protein